MNSNEMSMLDDDGNPLDLSTVLALFLTPNCTMIFLTIFIAYLVHVSKRRPRLNYFLGKLANFFAKGALDRIIKNMLRHFEKKKRQHEGQTSSKQMRRLGKRKTSFISQNSSTSNSNFVSKKEYDANYLLIVPFQIDLLLTVFVYKILTRDVYPETCQSYLTTYHNRQTQVICWLKTINKNVSSLSSNITLYQYCTNQTITYINYEHNDVVCAQFIFRLINIIDTVTNMFAWHQAVVFVVTKSIVCSYWYQDKLRKSMCWSNLFYHHRRIILYIGVSFVLSIYIFLFVFILPIQFALIERRRVDLTRHLLYACLKFLTAIILHVNLYTLYQWHSHTIQKYPVLIINEESEIDRSQPADSVVSIGNSEYGSVCSTMMAKEYLGAPSKTYLTTTNSL